MQLSTFPFHGQNPRYFKKCIMETARDRYRVVASAEDDRDYDEDDETLDGHHGGPKKKVKLTGRPMCTNCEQCMNQSWLSGTFE